LEIYRLAAAYVEDAAVHQGYAETLDVTASCPVMEAARAAALVAMVPPNEPRSPWDPGVELMGGF